VDQALELWSNTGAVLFPDFTKDPAWQALCEKRFAMENSLW
jgi:hypothetical protein